jgi:hypothetical protein
MFKWLKKLRLIVDAYHTDLLRTREKLAALETLVRDRTEISVDLGFREKNYAVVVGRYRGSDYVQTYILREADLVGLIEQLRDMERHGHLDRIDAPPQFRAVFKRDLNF